MEQPPQLGLQLPKMKPNMTLSGPFGLTSRVGSQAGGVGGGTDEELRWAAIDEDEAAGGGATGREEAATAASGQGLRARRRCAVAAGGGRDGGRRRADGARAEGGRPRRAVAEDDGADGRRATGADGSAATGGGQRMATTDLPAPHARRRAGAAVDPRRADLHRHRPHGWTERRRAGTDGTPGGDGRMRAGTTGSAAMGKKIGTLLCSAASTQPTRGKMGLGLGFAAPGSKNGSSRGQHSGMTKGGGPDLDRDLLCYHVTNGGLLY